MYVKVLSLTHTIILFMTNFEHCQISRTVSPNLQLGLVTSLQGQARHLGRTSTLHWVSVV